MVIFRTEKVLTLLLFPIFRFAKNDSSKLCRLSVSFGFSI